MEYNHYGPGSDFIINTLEEFHVHLQFGHSDTLLTEYSVTLTQDVRSVEMGSGCGLGQLLTDDLKGGMTFVMSNWSLMDNKFWFDRCEAEVCSPGDMYYKNITIKTGGDKQVAL